VIGVRSEDGYYRKGARKGRKGCVFGARIPVISFCNIINLSSLLARLFPLLDFAITFARHEARCWTSVAGRCALLELAISFAERDVRSATKLAAGPTVAPSPRER